KKGRSIAIFGDTRYHASYANFIQNVDVLIHEATFAADNDTLANKYHHSTTKQAAWLAKQANVGTLLLTHISSRYYNEDDLMFAKESSAIISHTFIASNFYKYKV